MDKELKEFLEAMKQELKDDMKTMETSLRADMKTMEVRLNKSIDSVENKMISSEASLIIRLDGIDKRLDGIDKRFDGMDKKIDKIDEKVSINYNLILDLVGVVDENNKDAIELKETIEILEERTSLNTKMIDLNTKRINELKRSKEA